MIYIQIVDQFHLVMNYSECVYKTIKSLIPELKELNTLNSTPVLKNSTLEKEIKKLNSQDLSCRKTTQQLSMYKKQLLNRLKIKSVI